MKFSDARTIVFLFLIQMYPIHNHSNVFSDFILWYCRTIFHLSLENYLLFGHLSFILLSPPVWQKMWLPPIWANKKTEKMLLLRAIAFIQKENIFLKFFVARKIIQIDLHLLHTVRWYKGYRYTNKIKSVCACWKLSAIILHSRIPDVPQTLIKRFSKSIMNNNHT